MTRTNGAQFSVQLPSGEFAELLSGQHIGTHLGPIPLPGFDVLFLAITNADGFKIAGQAASLIAGTWEWARGEWRHVSPEAPGVYPVLYDERGSLHIAGHAQGSQGWRYLAEDGDLVSGDATLNAPRWNDAGRTPRVDPPLWEFAYLGGVFIGQGEGGCDVLIDGTRRRLLDGDTRFIRVSYDGTRWGVGLTRLHERDGWRWTLTREDLLALPLVSDAPPNPPNPPEPSMLMPLDAWRVIEQMHARFAHTFPETEDGARGFTEMTLQQLAFTFPDGGWCWKRASVDRPPSKDCAARQVDGRFEGWDILAAAGHTGPRVLAAYPPVWHDLIADGHQVPIAVSPVNHLGVTPPIPQPPIPQPPVPNPPTPNPTPPPTDQLGLILYELRRLNAHVGVR